MGSLLASPFPVDMSTVMRLRRTETFAILVPIAAEAWVVASPLVDRQASALLPEAA
jgi:hypothetical protein